MQDELGSYIFDVHVSLHLKLHHEFLKGNHKTIHQTSWNLLSGSHAQITTLNSLNGSSAQPLVTF